MLIQSLKAFAYRCPAPSNRKTCRPSVARGHDCINQQQTHDDSAQFSSKLCASCPLCPAAREQLLEVRPPVRLSSWWGTPGNKQHRAVSTYKRTGKSASQTMKLRSSGCRVWTAREQQPNQGRFNKRIQPIPIAGLRGHTRDENISKIEF